MKTTYHSKQSGSTLIVVVSVLATLMVIVGVAAEYTSTIGRHVQRSNTLENATAAADGAIEILFANWRAKCRTTPHLPMTTNDFSTIALPTAAQLNLPAVANFVKRGTGIDPTVDQLDSTFTISNYKVIAVTPEWTSLGSGSAAPIPGVGLAQTGVMNTTSANYDYIASANVTLPTLRGNIVAKVRRVFQKQQISPWNFAIFYVDPLEIHPGPPFKVTGWVHTNSDLYTGHSSLTFADKVTFGSDWFAPTLANPNAGFKPGDLYHTETPTAPNYPANLPPAHDDAKQPFGLDATQIFNTTDANPNNDSYREIIEPPSPSPDPLAASRYWDQASVVVRVDGSNAVTIGRPNPNGTITAFGPSSTGNDLILYNMFNTAGAITTNQSIQDDREGGSIRLVTLDLSKIQYNTNTLSPSFKATPTQGFNGIVYVYDSSATTSTKRGVRLKNGSRIDSRGLSVVSNNPVYIQGDYNSGRDYSGGTTPPSNYTTNNDPTTPQVSGYTRAPCSVLADAVTILSNSWDDLLAGSEPAASNTTVNTAIIAGIVPTAPIGGNGSYSGGAENFPRFLETWTNFKLTYYGSMVELYKSQQATGQWRTTGVYSPPVRQWYFDNNFKLKPPPGTIMVYSYVKGKWSLL